MISIIIPTYNESGSIRPLIDYLRRYGGSNVHEIIISDGGSLDDTCDNATNSGAIVLRSPQKGRATQMNFGALKASGSILYFVHADCYPPVSFASDISIAIGENYSFGRFRTKFDSNKLALRLNALFTRFDLFVCYGGDQTLFITRDFFDRIHGFKTEMSIMEDYDIVMRGRELGRYKIIQKDVLVSARKYNSNSWLSVQRANYRIVKMFKKGASQKDMAETYKQLLNYR